MPNSETDQTQPIEELIPLLVEPINKLDNPQGNTTLELTTPHWFYDHSRKIAISTEATVSSLDELIVFFDLFGSLGWWNIIIVIIFPFRIYGEYLIHGEVYKYSSEYYLDKELLEELLIIYLTKLQKQNNNNQISNKIEVDNNLIKKCQYRLYSETPWYKSLKIGIYADLLFSLLIIFLYSWELSPWHINIFFGCINMLPWLILIAISILTILIIYYLINHDPEYHPSAQCGILLLLHQIKKEDLKSQSIKTTVINNEAINNIKDNNSFGVGITSSNEQPLTQGEVVEKIRPLLRGNIDDENIDDKNIHKLTQYLYIYSYILFKKYNLNSDVTQDIKDLYQPPPIPKYIYNGHKNGFIEKIKEEWQYLLLSFLYMLLTEIIPSIISFIIFAESLKFFIIPAIIIWTGSFLVCSEDILKEVNDKKDNQYQAYLAQLEYAKAFTQLRLEQELHLTSDQLDQFQPKIEEPKINLCWELLKLIFKCSGIALNLVMTLPAIHSGAVWFYGFCGVDLITCICTIPIDPITLIFFAVIVCTSLIYFKMQLTQYAKKSNVINSI